MSRGSSRKWLSLGLSVLVSVGLLWAVVAQLRWRELLETLRAVDWWWVVAGTIMMLFYHWFRGERFRHLMRIPRSGRMYTTMCLQSFFRKFLPSWLGEASQIWLLNRRHGATVPRGTALLLVARVVDLSIFLAALVLALAFTATRVEGTIAWVVVLLTLALVVVVGGLVLLLRFEAWVDHASHHRSRPVAWFAVKASQLIAGVREGAHAHVLLPVIAHSTAMWLLMYLRLFCFVHALGADLALLQIFWVFVLLFPMNLLPIRGVANLGTHEAAWFIGLSLVGVARERAAVLAVGSHLLIFVAVGVCLLVGLAGLAIEAAAARKPRHSAT